MNERLVKFIDQSFCSCVVKLHHLFSFSARPYVPAEIEHYQRFLIIRPGGMGDAALLLPLLRTLATREKKVSLICNRRNEEVCRLFRACGLLEEMYSLESLQNIRRCRSLKFDCVLDTEQSFYSSALIGRYINARLMIGFDTNERRGLYDYFVHYRQEEYEAQSFLNLLSPFGIVAPFNHSDLRLPSLPLPPQAQFEGSSLVVFGGAHLPTRTLPAALVNEVLRRVSGRFAHIIAIGGPSEREQAAEFLRDVPNAQNLAGLTSLEGTVALLQRSSAFLSSDSGPLHLGALAGVPRICAVFGAGIERKWGEPSLMRIVTSQATPCRPCNYARFSQTPPCPFGVACLSSIQAEKLVKALTD